jgi:hypothetical protein
MTSSIGSALLLIGIIGAINYNRTIWAVIFYLLILIGLDIELNKRAK